MRLHAPTDDGIEAVPPIHEIGSSDLLVLGWRLRDEQAVDDDLKQRLGEERRGEEPVEAFESLLAKGGKEGMPRAVRRGCQGR